MAEIVTMEGFSCDPRQANAEVVRVLEEILERAKSGDIIGIAIAGINFDRSVFDAYSGQASQAAVIGSMFRLATELSKL